MEKIIKTLLSAGLGFALGLCFASTAGGQATGSFSGTVLDKTGSAISGATVTATSPASLVLQPEARTSNFAASSGFGSINATVEQPGGSALRSQADVFAAWGVAQRLGQMDLR